MAVPQGPYPDQASEGWLTFGVRRGPSEVHRASGPITSATEGIVLTHDTSPYNVALVVRLPRDLRDELVQRAATEDRSVASLMRRAARAYLAAGLEPQP